MEDCSATSTFGVSLPNDLIVDARIVCRRNVPGFYVSSYSASTKTIIISSNDNAVSISIPLAEISEESIPLRVTASSADPDYSGYYDVKAFLTIGAGVLDFILQNNFDVSFLPTQTPIENSCVMDISGSVVNLFGAIKSAPSQPFVVKRDVSINGGYNTRVNQSEKRINVFTDASGGQLGKYYGTEGESPCSGIVFSINGVQPDTLGKFSFVPKTGISIQQFAETHSITISLDTTDMGSAQCSA